MTGVGEREGGDACVCVSVCVCMYVCVRVFDLDSCPCVCVCVYFSPYLLTSFTLLSLLVLIDCSYLFVYLFIHVIIRPTPFLLLYSLL